MRTLTFSNGDELPALGLGTWKSDNGEVYDAVREAIRIGYRHIDCAAIYGNEAKIGEALEDAFKAGDVKREDLWITSKLWNTSHRRSQVGPALEKTLKDLRLDYLDLYLMHWPVALKQNPNFPYGPEDFLSLEEVPLDETWEAMVACRDKGLARHIGVANFNIRNLRKLLAQGFHPEMNQIEMHPLLQQTDMLDFCMDHDIHLTAYSPLGSRDRSDKVKSDDEPDLFEDPTIKRIAKNHACTPAQVLIQWAITRGTAVIPKSTSPDHLRQNFDAADLHIPANEMQWIRDMDREYRYIDGSFWTPKGSPYSLEYLWGE